MVETENIDFLIFFTKIIKQLMFLVQIMINDQGIDAVEFCHHFIYSDVTFWIQ